MFGFVSKVVSQTTSANFHRGLINSMLRQGAIVSGSGYVSLVCCCCSNWYAGVLLPKLLHLHFHFSTSSRRFSPKWLAVIHTYFHTPIGVAATQGAAQHIRSSLGFSILPKDTSTCRPGESNRKFTTQEVQLPKDNQNNRYRLSGLWWCCCCSRSSQDKL